MISNYFKPQNLSDDKIKIMFKGTGAKLNATFNPDVELYSEKLIVRIENYCNVFEMLILEMSKRKVFEKNKDLFKENLNSIKNIKNRMLHSKLFLGAVAMGK